MGQIIDRVQAEDPDNDVLVFGMEPRFLSPMESSQQSKLPFRIDPVTGVIYLNESLAGRVSIIRIHSKFIELF